jgi:pyruvate/2-oxoglutarate dehydrogenase complex dihydrolipoamide dehydrogenase (E3) component
MYGKGVTGELRIDWRELMAFKRSFTDPIPMKQEQRYAQDGIDTFHGTARFTGPDALAVAATSSGRMPRMTSTCSGSPFDTESVRTI